MSLKHISTKEDYEVYCARVQHFLAVNDVKPGCFSPVKPDSEPFFSWHNCHCCNRPLGGNREHYAFATNNGHMFDGAICTDCIYFLTYGQLDDMTMLELK